MIYSLKGIVQELSPTYAIMEVAGVGYFVGVSLQTSQQLETSKAAFLYIQQIFREDAHLLFGFKTKDEKEMFNYLISVNGVGPSSALIMLSSLSIPEIASGIMSGNALMLQKVKGIGTKTAERIIVELKDKLQKFGMLESQLLLVESNKTKEESLSALEVLGIPKRNSEKLADRFLKQNPDISVEELVKQILKSI